MTKLRSVHFFPLSGSAVILSNMVSASQGQKSFFEEKYREALSFCGSKSGRDVDKVSATGLTPIASESGSIYFEEARLVMECRKIYYQDIVPANFLDSENIEKCYNGQDYHRVYVGEILGCYGKDYQG